MEKLDWIEFAALENLRSKHENAELIMREANTTLTILLSGIGVVFAYAVSQWSTNAALSYTALISTGYMVAIAFILINKCLKLQDFPALYNEFNNLNQPDMSFDELRLAELKNIQARSEEADNIIFDRSCWLNRLRMSIATTPIIAAVAWLAVHYLRQLLHSYA